MKLRSSALLSCIALSAAACSSSGSEAPGSRVAETPVSSPQAFTVSYRNRVRLPKAGEVLSAEAFASQVHTRDPVSPIRCAAEESAAFRDISAFLGGIAWSHPVAIIKDQSFPPLYDGKYTAPPPSAEAASDSAGGAAPVIERPDLVGVQNGIAIFLSKQHGLSAVDTRSGTPLLSCAMKLPGTPMNFLFHGNELVVVVNAGRGQSRSALLRYSFEGGTFRFVDSVRFEDQTITDARAFDSTIVAYTAWNKPGTKPAGGGGGGFGGGMGEASSGDAIYNPNTNRLGSKVLVVQWDEKLELDYEDSLLDDVAKQNPMEGKDPATKYVAGELVSETKTYASFVAASDRYFVVPRKVRKTLFARYETQSYSYCTSYNPKYQQVQYCSVQYEKRANPDYKAPNPTTGDYACNGKTLAACIGEAAPTVSQYVYAPVGRKCEDVWQGRCEASEIRNTTYPRFEEKEETELTIYRFEAGTFTKLDATLAKMVQKSDALAFEKGPLTVPGAVSSRNQIQFQNGQLYVVADGALQTMSVAGSSIAYLNRLPLPETSDKIYGGTPTVVFSSDRAMVSSAQYRQGTMFSTVTMLDLTTPFAPKTLPSFTMPGQTSQLILANGGILGPGTVSFEGGNVYRTLQKVTLFSKEGGQELDNLLVGTEYDALQSSYFDASDDQRLRLGANGTRLFLPYSGRAHADQYAPVAHRLNITRIDNSRLVSERSFAVSDDIVRTAGLDDDRSLVFGDSATYLVQRPAGSPAASADWSLTTLREHFVPFGTYRLNDGELHARVARVGSKCRVTTHAGDAKIFDDGQLAEAFIPCGEGTLPVGFGHGLLFLATRTGVQISPDGKSIVALQASEVEALEDKIPKGICWIESGNTKNGQLVDHLDEVPAKIVCGMPSEDTTGGAVTRD